VFIIGLNELLFSPVIKAAVVMEGDDRGDGEFGTFRNKKVTRHFHISSRPEVQPFSNVVTSVNAVEDARSGVYGLRPIGHQVEDFGASFSLPGFEVLRSAVEKGQALAGLFLLTFNKGVEVPER
jgi:hypothetical protein